MVLQEDDRNGRDWGGRRRRRLEMEKGRKGNINVSFVGEGVITKAKYASDDEENNYAS